MQSGNIPTGGGGRWWEALLPIVGSVAGGIIDKASQDASNKANAQNVDKQIEFQREQNATQYQRATADLIASGLNPALAYKQGGNNSGSGAAAENRAVSHGQRFQQAIDAYNQFANGTAQRQLIREQANATYQQALKTRLESNVIQPAASLGTSSDYITEYARAQLARRRGERFTAEKTEEQYMTNLGATKQATATGRQQEELMRTQATLNEQQFMNEWFRKNVAPYLNSTARTLQGVGDVARTGKGLTGITPFARYY